jgi:hypothetical protein
MLNGLAVRVHPIDVDAGDAGVLGIVIEQIQKIYMSPDIVADGGDTVDHNASIGACAVTWPKYWPNAIDPPQSTGCAGRMRG